MNFIFFFASLKNSNNMNFIFCKLKKPQKALISFFVSLKTSQNMNFIFCKLKNLKKHDFGGLGHGRVGWRLCFHRAFI